MQGAITFADACNEPALFADWFGAESWSTWRVLDRAMFGLPLDDEELKVFQSLTGRSEAPTEQMEEVWLICGRRSGKDTKAAALATYLSTIGAEIFGWKQRLVRGERGVIQLLAVDRDQAAVAFRYISGFFEKPIFAQMVARRTADTIELTNGFAIEVATADQRRVRGRTLVACILDEIAFFRSENTSSPDIDIYRAIKPAMATMPGAMIIGISSPYARKGLLWKKYQTNFGKPGKVLVVKAPTWVMNPTLPRDSDFIREAYADDPESAVAELGAEFRSDISSFISREAVEACVEVGVRERPPLREHLYHAFIDVSGGSSDSFCVAIAHKVGTTVVLDAIRETVPPFSPESVVIEYSELMKRYRIARATSDRYSGEWMKEPFQRSGIYIDQSARPKTELYKDLLPVINSRAVDLLDHPKMVSQIASLERRVGRSGRDIIQEAPGLHDDISNVVAGVVAAAAIVYSINPAEDAKWRGFRGKRAPC